MWLSTITQDNHGGCLRIARQAQGLYMARGLREPRFSHLPVAGRGAGRGADPRQKLTAG